MAADESGRTRDHGEAEPPITESPGTPGVSLRDQVAKDYLRFNEDAHLGAGRKQDGQW